MPGSTLGAGFSLAKANNNPNPIQHGAMGQAERAFSAASTFLSGVMAISASQFIGAPLKLVDPKFHDSYMAWTKESFAVLVTTMTQWWAPTIVRVSGDESMKGQLYQMDDGSLKCNFPHRLVLMANHQLYTDWLYLWWIAYTNKMHGRIYIILKESLKQIPIFGWGAQFYNFIFLSRNWETDKYRFRKHLNVLKDPKDPMWLLIFPEGTNLSAVTREKSKSWADKTGIQDMKNQLLPRSIGLQFCLQELKQSTNWLYDCTIAYEGVPKGMYGQDIFTLRSSFLDGRPPKSVNMYWRRYKISDIPTENDQAFSRWLNNRWREKDYFLEYFNKFGNFPAGDAAEAMQAVAGKGEPRHAKLISTEVKAGGWDEFLGIFGPITTAAGALQNVDLTEPLNLDELLGKVAQQQQLNLLMGGNSPKATTSQEAIKNAMMAAQKRFPLQGSIFNSVIGQPPQTQAQMKSALIKSGDAKVAKAASKAPGAKAALPNATQQKMVNVARQTQKSLEDSYPAPAVRKTMPGVPMETVITKPISSFAMQKAVNTITNAAAARTQQKGAALPGQRNPGQASTQPGKPATNGIKAQGNARRVVNGVPTANGTRRPSIQRSSASTTAPRKLPSGGGPSASSRAIGTQKYASGKIP